MDKDPNKNEEERELRNSHERSNDAAKDNQGKAHKHPVDDADIDDTDKYLALEQQGVTYTPEKDPTINSDQSDFGSESRKREWNDEGGNSKYSDAFNQDDYILEDNLDLDEDQNQSISSDDDDFEETNERY